MTALNVIWSVPPSKVKSLCSKPHTTFCNCKTLKVASSNHQHTTNRDEKHPTSGTTDNIGVYWNKELIRCKSTLTSSHVNDPSVSFRFNTFVLPTMSDFDVLFTWYIPNPICHHFILPNSDGCRRLITNPYILQHAQELLVHSQPRTWD